jgi:hypothetical protein
MLSLAIPLTALAIPLTAQSLKQLVEVSQGRLHQHSPLTIGSYACRPLPARVRPEPCYGTQFMPLRSVNEEAKVLNIREMAAQYWAVFCANSSDMSILAS